MAVSSLRARASLPRHLDLLEMTDVEAVLVSSLDLADMGKERAPAEELLRGMVAAGIHVLIDSGGYEAYWTKRTEWTATQHWQVVESLPGSAALGFDYPQPMTDDIPAVVKHAIAGCPATPVGCAGVIPIVHAPSAQLAGAVTAVAQAASAPLIGVPERRLGEGILDRVRKVQEIRGQLEAVGLGSTGIHILGAANPLDVVCYTWAGAESFDGLEWNRALLDVDALDCRGASEWQLRRRSLDGFDGSDMPYLESLWAYNLLALQALVGDLRHSPTSAARRRLAAARPDVLGLLESDA